MLIATASAGTLLGSWLGYKLRKLVERPRDSDDKRASKKPSALRNFARAWAGKPPLASKPFITAGSVGEWKTEPHREWKPGHRVMREQRQVIPITSLSRNSGDGISFAHPSYAPPVVNQDREEVIAALYGAGYNKKTATAAVDECSLAERASGIESWTRAALKHAFKAKAK